MREHINHWKRRCNRWCELAGLPLPYPELGT